VQLLKGVELYGWYYMSVTVHKLLIHGADIIQNCIVPIGNLSEEASEGTAVNGVQSWLNFEMDVLIKTVQATQLEVRENPKQNKQIEQGGLQQWKLEIAELSKQIRELKGEI
jgi:hypothetical protein